MAKLYLPATAIHKEATMHLDRFRVREIFSLFILLFSFTCARADTASDIDTLLNWAEVEYPELFSPAATSQTFDVWRFRYYSDLDVYAGVNDQNDVYVLGDIFGGLLFIAPLADLLALVPDTSMPPTGPGGIVNAGNGNCVEGAFPAVGLVGVYDITSSLAPGSVTQWTNSILESSSSVFKQQFQISSNIPGVGSSSSSGTMTLNVRIQGDLVYNISQEVATTSTTLGTTTMMSSATTYNPEQLSGTLTACEGQVFQVPSVNATTVTTTTINGVSTNNTTSFPTGGTTITTESIADVITTAAGPFTTIRNRTQDNDDTSYSINWVDRNSNMPVKIEVYDPNGNLLSTQELIRLSN